jgi:uncharacterized membrane protein
VRAAIHDYVPQVVPFGAASGRARALWGAVVLVACAFVGLIACAPLALAEGRAGAAAVLYQAFGAICHQLPGRSFFLAGHPLAVCARCFGVYAGFALGALGYPLVRALARTDVPARRWLAVAALPTTIDFLLGVTGLWANTHASRALTGALLGAVAALYVVPGLNSCLGAGRRRAPAVLKSSLNIPEPDWSKET